VDDPTTVSFLTQVFRSRPAEIGIRHVLPHLGARTSFPYSHCGRGEDSARVVQPFARRLDPDRWANGSSVVGRFTVRLCPPRQSSHKTTACLTEVSRPSLGPPSIHLARVLSASRGTPAHLPASLRSCAALAIRSVRGATLLFEHACRTGALHDHHQFIILLGVYDIAIFSVASYFLLNHDQGLVQL
jgi:hypothetical protein